MKKLIILFVCMLSTLIFFQIYQLSIQKEFTELTNLPITLQSKLQAKELVAIQITIADDKEKSELTKLFSDFLKESKTTGLIASYQQEDEKNLISNFYVYPNDSISVQYFQSLAPKTNLKSENEINYATTTSTKSNEQKIPLLNSSSFKKIGNQVSIHPFDHIYEDQGYQFTGEYLAFIPSNNKQLVFNQFMSFLKENYPQYEKNISLVDFASNWDEVYGKELTLLSYYILIICIVILVLLTTFVIKQSKQIFIMKLQGISNMKVLTHLYSPLLLKSNLVYLIVQVILYFFIVGSMNSVAYTFLFLLMKHYIIFAFCSFIIFCFTYFYLKFLFKANNYLMQSNLSQIYKINFILKIAVTILTISPFIVTWNENYPYINDILVMSKNKQNISNYYTMSNTFEYKGETIKKFMKDSEYVDFSSYEIYMNDQEASKPGDFPYIYVNDNYLKKYKLFNENNEPLNLNTLKNGDLLVPSGTVPFNKDFFCYGMKCNIVYYTNDVTFLNYIPTAFLHTVRNPVIQFYSDYNPAYRYSEGNLYLPKSKTSDFYKNKFREISQKTKLSLQDNQYMYANYENSRNQAIIKISLVTFITLFIYLSFVYQSVFVFLNDQQKKLAIQYIQGYTKWQRYSVLYLSNSISLMIACIISIILLKLPAVDVIRYTAILILIESSQITFLVHYFHSRSLSQILKGDQL